MLKNSKRLFFIGLLVFSTTSMYAVTPNEVLIDAVGKGDILRVQEALADGAHVNAQNSDDYTPLYQAAIKGHKDIVNILLRHGADVNTQNKYGDAPLYSAIWERFWRLRSDFLKLLHLTIEGLDLH